MSEPPAELLDRRSEPEARAVLEDWLSERGRDLQWLGAVATSHADAVAAAAADAADAADADDDDAAAATDVDDDAAADADADTADAADAADAANGQAFKAVNRMTRGNEMREGLKVLVVPGSYWSLTQIGWLRRIDGDEWELVDARVLRRVGGRVPLATLAAEGPGETIHVEKAAELPEEIHRLTIRRCIPANEKAWMEYCPKPTGWVER